MLHKTIYPALLNESLFEEERMIITSHNLIPSNLPYYGLNQLADYQSQSQDVLCSVECV